MASQEHPYIVFILGAPGSGKGTICQKIARDFGFFHLSVGDYMRELSRDPTFDNDTEAIKDHLKQGKLLPTEMILPILQQKMDKEKAKGHHHFLIDGFPRKVSQGIEFEKQILAPALVISLQCPKDAARQRYLNRRLPGRLHDDKEMFEKRFEEFEVENANIIYYYRSKGILEELDSSTETETTYARFLETIGRKKDGWVTRISSNRTTE